MNIRKKLGTAFTLTTGLLLVIGGLSLQLSAEVAQIRSLELPMEQNLREVEVSLWETIHAADAFRLTGDPYYQSLFQRQRKEVEDFFGRYRELADTPFERAQTKEFDRLWREATSHAARLMEETRRQRQSEVRLYEQLELTDRVIDFEIQAVLSDADPHVLAKERRVREVEVSLWEMGQALQQFTGLAPIAIVGQDSVDFARLMELQIHDVETEWAAYQRLIASEAERTAAKRFETHWQPAVAEARAVIDSHREALVHYQELYRTIDVLDDIVDFKLQDGIASRIELRNVNAERLHSVILWLLIFAIGVSGFIAFVTSRSVLGGLRRTRELEEQLRQSQKMEAVGRLAGGVAHDFNNLLQAIQGNATLALEDLPPSSPLREDVEEIRHAADRATELTRQLLTFSRPQMVQREPLDLNAVVSGTHRMLRRLLTQEIELVTLLGPDPGYVEWDRGQVEQVLVNLVVNARDAMPNGGTLTIETSRTMVAPRGRRGAPAGIPCPHVLLSVSDTGGGMDTRTQERIFEPFFSTKAQGKGTGLGLSTVYGIVQQSGGWIEVDSKVGQGSTFRIFVPCADAAPVEEHQPAQPAMLEAGSETVLVVDDEPAVRRLACLVLQRNGYMVLEACNGEEALRTAERHDGAIDLLLTDVVMPLMGGWELGEKFALLYPDAQILYMSGYNEMSTGSSTPAPDVPLLKKPFDLPVLVQTVRSVLDGKMVMG